MSTKEKRIGFVGLGRMGANMARNLKDKGYQISMVYDINESVASSLADELGSQAASSLTEVTAHSDVILTVVTNDAATPADECRNTLSAGNRYQPEQSGTVDRDDHPGGDPVCFNRGQSRYTNPQ